EIARVSFVRTVLMACGRKATVVSVAATYPVHSMFIARQPRARRLQDRCRQEREGVGQAAAAPATDGPCEASPGKSPYRRGPRGPRKGGGPGPRRERGLVGCPALFRDAFSPDVRSARRRRVRPTRPGIRRPALLGRHARLRGERGQREAEVLLPLDAAVPLGRAAHGPRA